MSKIKMSLTPISMAALIANDYSDKLEALREDYGKIIKTKLRQSLTSQAVLAGALGGSVELSAVGQKKGWVNKALSYLAKHLILRILVALGIGVLITGALTLFPFIGMTAPAVLALLGSGIATSVYTLFNFGE